MKKVASKTGNMPKLLEGVGQVTAGVARIMEFCNRRDTPTFALKNWALF